MIAHSNAAINVKPNLMLDKCSLISSMVPFGRGRSCFMGWEA